MIYLANASISGSFLLFFILNLQPFTEILSLSPFFFLECWLGSVLFRDFLAVAVV
jgi:hypothetical protein